MKPNFALHFTDTSIALLHRTAKGWLKIGDTPFDAPDLEEALDYLRKTALGLEPAGFTTKLVIPNDQILYAEVEAPGPDETVRRSQIGSAIEARTPYKADEVVFDWSGRGRNVKVAAVARETLAEAEGFAVMHRFNPVGFVAIPADGSFSGEPWFGVTDVAESLIGPGETIDRDKQPIVLLADGPRRTRRQTTPETDPAEVAAQAAPAQPEPEPPETEQPAAALPETPAYAAEAASDVDAGHPPADEAPAEGEHTGESAEPEVAPEIDTSAGSQQTAAPSWEAPTPAAEPLQPAPAEPRNQHEMRFDAPAPAEPETAEREAAVPEAEVPEQTAITPPPAAPEAPRSNGPSLSISGVHATRSTPPVAPALSPPASAEEVSAAPVARPPAESLSGPAAKDQLPVEDVDEAPFAHIGDGDDEELNLRRRPAPRPGDRLAERLAADTRAEQRKAAIPPALRADEGEEDLPPLPSSAVLAARAKSAGLAAPGPAGRAAPPVTAASRVVPPVTAARTEPRMEPQFAGATSALARGKQIEDLPPLPEKPPVAAPKARSGKPAAAAPALPAGRRPKAKASPADDRVAPPPADAARSLGRSPFAAKAAQRGKPRHLGLILIAILLLCLALVAAWSSIYLASGRDSGTSYAAADPNGTTNGEGLMDGPDPEALADGYTGEDEAALEPETTEDPALATAAAEGEPAPDPAPETAVSSDSPAPVALADTQDEIFLSAADAPPPAFDAAALPSPEAGAEAPPEAPMPPPPFGLVYQFDDQGLIVPQAAGIPSPDGYTIFAGKPKRVPPARSAVAEAAAEAARQIEATPVVAPAATPATAPAETAPGNDTSGALDGAAAPANATAAAAAAAGHPSLVAALPLGDTAPAADSAPGVVPQPEAQPNPELAGLRPRNRPATEVAAADAAPSAEAGATAGTETPEAAPAAETPQFAGPRPRERSAAVTAAATAAAEAAEAETLQAAAAAAGNPSLLKISRRPEARPRDFSRAVEAAVAAAVRTPEPPAPEPEPEAAPAPTAPAPVAVAAAPAPSAAPTASAAPQSPPTGKRGSRAEAKGTAIKPEEQDEINEPELASAAAPKIPTKASVAKNATFAKAINLSKINLIGVYGSQSNRYALIRQTNGKYKKVKVGDRIDGGQIQAITQNEVRYQKGGRLVSLEMPKG